MTGIYLPLHTTNNLTLQFFLTEDPPGVCEVGPCPSEEHEKTFRLRCTCTEYTDEDTCRHCVLVAMRILEHPRHYYPVRVIGGLAGSGINLAVQDAMIMRHWMIHYTEILVD